MYRADYRGGGSRVVVLPQGGTSFTHMIVDFEGPNHASVAAVGCALARLGSCATAPAANTTPAADAPATKQWVLLGTSAANGGMDVYVARSAIRRSGDSAQMRDLWDFKTIHMFEGKPFLSTRNHYEYDCAGTRRRMLSTAGFSGHIGQGAVVGSGSSTRVGADPARRADSRLLEDRLREQRILNSLQPAGRRAVGALHLLRCGSVPFHR